MTNEAIAYQAVNLAQGFPSFDGPSEIKEAAIQAMLSGRNQYAPSVGIPQLREGLARRYHPRLNRRLDWQSEITIFSGATEALWCAFQGLFSEGDEVVVFDPYFVCYPANAHSVGAHLRPVRLHYPHWTFDQDSLSRAITPQTRAILLNTPHNPTGKVFSNDELEYIASIAIKHDLLIITDEVYEDLTFDHHRHISIASFPKMFDRTLTISSFSKSFSFTGWKVGYALGPKNLTDALRRVHQFTVFCSATPLQWGMVRALDFDDSYFTEFRNQYDQKRRLLHSILNQCGISCSLAEGSYFLIGNYSEISGLPDHEFALWLTRNVKVACLPLSAFAHDQETFKRDERLLRFAFCKDESILLEAKNRLLTLQK